MVGVSLALLAALAVATLGLLAFLAVYLLPHPLMEVLGFGCVHQALCTHGLPLWAQISIWLPPVGLLGWVLVSLTRTIVRHARSNRRTEAMVKLRGRRLDPCDRFARYEVTDERLFAFTAGLLHPVVVVSSALVRALSSEEITAVLAHEEAHATRHDNLALTFVNAAARALFFLPGVARSADSVRRHVELAADARAGDRIGDALSVAGAVTRVAGLLLQASGDRVTVSAVPRAATGFSHDDLVVERVERLVFDTQRTSSRRRLLTSLVALVLVFLVVCSSGYAVGAGSLGGADQTAACLEIQGH